MNVNVQGLLTVFGIVIVGLAGIAFAALAFAALAFIALVMTAICLVTWNTELKTVAGSIKPEDARAFVYRGLMGAVLLFGFTLFVCALYGLPFREPWTYYIPILGYCLGSVGVDFLMDEPQAPGTADLSLNLPDIQPPPPSLPPPSRQTDGAPAFRFASWNDDEELRR